jgi:putative spermidine/putrescine transport system permease protein
LSPRLPRERRGLWLLLPVVALLLVFFLYPVGQLLLLSFRTPEGEWTLGQYLKIAADPVFLQVMVITFKIAAYTTLFCVIGGYPIAYLLATIPAAQRGRWMLWVLMPFWTSFLVRMFAWMILLGHNGPINRLLVTAGLVSQPLRLVYNLTGVLIGMVHGLMPLAVVMMFSVMQGIDTTLLRAGNTLGARGGQTFWRIYFPLSMPGVAAAATMVFITSIGFFITSALLGGAHETMISQVILSQVQELLNWSFAGALSVILLLATFALLAVFNGLVGVQGLAGQAAGSAPASRPHQRLRRATSGLAKKALAGLARLSADVAAFADRIVPSRAAGRGSRPVLRSLVVLLLLFLVLPSFFVVAASFTAGTTLELPPRGFSLRWYGVYLGSEQWLNATLNSLTLGVVSGLLALGAGTAAAFALVRHRLPGQRAFLYLLLSPMIIPRIVTAVALFYLYSRIGLVGTWIGLVLGHTVLAVPYVVVTMMAVLQTYDRRLDQAAATLGASDPRVLLRITLPMIRAGLLGAFLFAFITSFDELTVALFVTGGSFTTLPRQMWSDMLMQINPTLAAVATVLLLVVTAALLVGEKLRQRATA